jgi:hypothetical protein
MNSIRLKSDNIEFTLTVSHFRWVQVINRGGTPLRPVLYYIENSDRLYH